MADVVRASHAIVGAYDPDGVTVWQNNGIPARQSVPRTRPRRRNLAGRQHEWGQKSPALPSPRRTPLPPSSGHTYLSSTCPRITIHV
jgi:hypothetical protein